MVKSLKRWKVVSSEKVLENEFYSVRKDTCITTNGQIREYFVREKMDSAMVLALIDDRRLILEEQYRHGVGEVTFDFPAGKIERGESPLSAARRELLEETGFRARQIRRVGIIAYNPAVSESRCHIFVAKSISKSQMQSRPDSVEVIKLHFVAIPRLEQYIKSGKINCALCISAFHLAHRYLKINQPVLKN